MNSRTRIVLLIGGVLFLTIFSSYLSSRFFLNQRTSKDHHQWIHEKLNITADQERNLENTEHKYAERRKYFSELIHKGNMELAQAIREDRNYSERVSIALAKIQEAQIGLQKATLKHVFEMKESLTPEQYTKLLKLTADALYAEPHSPNH
jgi:nickel and cobalt resistance protein CnrR